MDWPDHPNGNGEPAEIQDAGALKSWLMGGSPASSVDPRRRSGRSSQARRLLAVDAVWVASAHGAWRGLVSALQRHTVHDALAQLRKEDRQILTLAFLQGLTNDEIGRMLQVSVRTVGRRIATALERLEEEVRKAGIWVVSIALAIFAPLMRSERWPQYVTVAAAGAATAVTAVSLGLVAVSPDGVTPGHPSAPSIATLVGLTPPLVGAGAQNSPSSPLTQETSTTPKGHTQNGGQSAGANEANNDADPSHSNNGCRGSRTGAPPDVPVGPRGGVTGTPVTPPHGPCKTS